jgi:hypothetical protein
MRARGSWAESAASWLGGKNHIDLSADRYAADYDELKKTILGMREQAPPLGPLPEGFKSPARSQSAQRVGSNAQHIDLELFGRRLAIHDATTRLICLRQRVPVANPDLNLLCWIQQSLLFLLGASQLIQTSDGHSRPRWKILNVSSVLATSICFRKGLPSCRNSRSGKRIPRGI